MEGPDMDDFPRVMRTLDARFLADLFPNLPHFDLDLDTDAADESVENSSSTKKKPGETAGSFKDDIIEDRSSPKPIEGDNVVFVNKKTNFKAQLEKCSDLLAKGEKEIILHGLGVAIEQCCNLAIQLQLAFRGTHDIEVNTGTTCIAETLIPIETEDIPEDDFDTQTRYQSSVHIRIFRTAMIGATATQ